MVGVVCASVVSAVLFPQPVTPALYASSRRNFTNLLSAVHEMLGRATAVAAFDTFLDLIRERAGVQSLRSGAVFEDPSIRLHHHVFLDLDRSFLVTVAWIHALHQLKARVEAEADPHALAAVGELLAASMAIFVMIGSYVNTFAKTSILGLGFNIYFCFIVGISNPTVYNPSAYLDTGFALLAGIAFAARKDYPINDGTGPHGVTHLSDPNLPLADGT
ncbi:MAG TPA: FUSC family protein [Paraburkholderia sp.]